MGKGCLARVDYELRIGRGILVHLVNRFAKDRFLDCQTFFKACFR